MGNRSSQKAEQKSQSTQVNKNVGQPKSQSVGRESSGVGGGRPSESAARYSGYSTHTMRTETRSSPAVVTVTVSTNRPSTPKEADGYPRFGLPTISQSSEDSRGLKRTRTAEISSRPVTFPENKASTYSQVNPEFLKFSSNHFQDISSKIAHENKASTSHVNPKTPQFTSNIAPNISHENKASASSHLNPKIPERPLSYHAVNVKLPDTELLQKNVLSSTDLSTSSKSTGQSNTKNVQMSTVEEDKNKPQFKKGKSMSVEKLTEVVNNYEPRLMTFILNNHYTGFFDLLHEDQLSLDTLKLVVKAVRSVSSCSECPHNMSALMQTVLYTKLFSTHLPKCLLHMKNEDVKWVVDVIFICNKLLVEFSFEAGNKLKATLEAGKSGVYGLKTKDIVTESCKVMFEDIMKSVQDLRSHHKNSSSNSEDGVEVTESVKICDIHVEMVKRELKDTLDRPETVTDDHAHFKVFVDGLEFSPTDGVLHKLKLTEDAVIKGRALLPGSLISLQNEDEQSESLMATVIDPQLDLGHILVKIDQTILDIKSKFVLKEGPVVYGKEFESLLKALSLAGQGEIGFIEQLKPAGMKPNQRAVLKQIESDMFCEKGVSAVATFPGDSGTDFGVNAAISARSRDLGKPVLVLCRHDWCLDEFLQKLMKSNLANRVVRVGGTESNNLAHITLNNRRKGFKFRDLPWANRRQLYEKMKRVKQDIQTEMDAWMMPFQSILDNESLITFMTNKERKFFNVESGTKMVHWLFPSLKTSVVVKVVDDTSQSSFKATRYSAFDVDIDRYLKNGELDRRISQFREDEFFDFVDQKRSEKSKMASEQPSTVSSIFDVHYVPLSVILKAAASTNDSDFDKKVHPSERSEEGRWNLYGSLLKRYWQSKMDKIKVLCAKYEKCAGQMREVIREYNLALMGQCDVVAMTTVAAITNHQLIRLLAPNTLLVLEAANTPEAHVVPFVGKQCQTLIVVGDLYGLRPRLNGALMTTGIQHVMSILERVTGNGVPCYCPPCCVPVPSFVSRFLKDCEWFQSVGFPTVEPEAVKRIYSNVLFLQHSKPDVLTAKGWHNPYEAQILVGLCRMLMKFNTAYKITVLACQASQWVYLTSSLANSGVQVDCLMVDHFAGQKSDIILLSLGGEVCEQIYSQRYVTSVLSMSKFGFYCIGNFDKLGPLRNDQTWFKLISYATVAGVAGGTGVLVCPKQHRMDELKLENHNGDVAKIIESGCRQSCGQSLKCGHLCRKQCHRSEKHSKRCKKKCSKMICPNHQKTCTNLCWEVCSKCPDDGHLPQKCDKILGCGHACPKLFTEPCETRCSELVQYHDSPCGHKIDIRCYEKSKSPMYLAMKCVTKCTDLRPCGHACSGTCGLCQGGKMHIPCEQECNRVLVCGHSCSEICEMDCPPCDKMVSTVCAHRGTINRLCGTVTDPCVQSCSIKCAHSACTRRCSEPCDRQVCNASCEKKYPCQHKCLGLCGELCPPQCVVCTSAVQQGNSRIIYLGDCGHSIDLNKMDEIVLANGPYYACPKCGTVIINSPRFHNDIISQQKELANMRLKYEWGQTSNTGLLVEILGVGRQDLSKDSISEAPNKQFQSARQQLLSEIDAVLSHPAVEVLKMKAAFYQMLVFLHQISNSLLSNSSHQLQVVDHVNKLLKWHRVLNETSSRRQLADFSRELRRVAYLAHLYTLTVIPKTPAHIISCFVLNQLQEQTPFTEEKMSKVHSCIKDLDRMTNAKTKFDSIEQRLPAVPNVPCMVANHWSRCSNGHWYYSGPDDSVSTPCDSCVNK